jgi:predicted phosphodiesterase
LPDLEDTLKANRSQKQVREDLKESIAEVEQAGYVVQRPLPKDVSAHTLDLEHITGKDRLKLAVVSCTHLGSKYQQVTALRDFCEYAAKVAKVDAFVHGGDFGDGPTSRHKNPTEVFKHDYGASRDYLVDTLPRTGKPWYVISGNHDEHRDRGHPHGLGLGLCLLVEDAEARRVTVRRTQTGCMSARELP